MREELMKLIASRHELLINLNTSIPKLFKLAEHLIANGVTIPVRCKDCKHWVEADNGSWQTIGRTDGACKLLVDIHHAERYMTEGEHSCSYGERRTDGRS